MHTLDVSDDVTILLHSHIDARPELHRVTMEIKPLLQCKSAEALHKSLVPAAFAPGVVPITIRLYCLPPLENKYARDGSPWSWAFLKDNPDEWKDTAQHFSDAYEKALRPLLESLNSFDALIEYLDGCPNAKEHCWEKYICLLILAMRQDKLDVCLQTIRDSASKGEPLTPFSKALLSSLSGWRS